MSATHLGLRQMVIYDHPRDHPEFWVVRGWTVLPSGLVPDRQAACFRSLEKARAWIAQEYPGLVLLPRFEEDDPAIAEVWT